MSWCFGYLIIDLFSLVKLPVIFDKSVQLVLSVLGVCRYKFFIFLPPVRPVAATGGVFLSEVQVLYHDSFSLVGRAWRKCVCRNVEFKTTNNNLVGNVTITRHYW